MLNKIKFIILFFLFIFIMSCSSDKDKLFKAVEDGNLSKIIDLVENGASVLSKNENGLTPLEIARKNNMKEIEEYLYSELKKVFDRETGIMLKNKFAKKLQELKDIETKRKLDYSIYLENNEKLLNSMNSDKRLSDQLLIEQEKYFKNHQESIKNFIDTKVDLIEEIMKVYINREYIENIESKDCRHIVNVNIMLRLSKM